MNLVLKLLKYKHLSYTSGRYNRMYKTGVNY